MTTMQQAEKEFLTVNELAAWLDLTEMTIYRLVKRGILPCHQIGRTKRFRRSEIETYLTQVRTGRM